MKKIIILLAFGLASFYSFSADYYWVGGAGNWTDLSHWAKSPSGTEKHIIAPGSNDNVIFDNNSFSSPTQTVNLNGMPADLACKNFNWITNKGRVSTHIFMGGINIYGNITITDSINFLIDQPLVINLLKNRAEGECIINIPNSSMLGILNVSSNTTARINGNRSYYSEINNNGILYIYANYININTLNNESSIGNILYLGNATIDVSSILAANIEGQDSRVFVRSYTNSGDNSTNKFNYIEFLGGLITDHNSSLVADSIVVNKFMTSNNYHFHSNGIIGAGHRITTNYIKFNSDVQNIMGVQVFTKKLEVDQSNRSCSNFLLIENVRFINTDSTINRWDGISFNYTNFHFVNFLGTNNIISNYGHNMGINCPKIVFNNIPSEKTLYWIAGKGNWNDPAHWSLSESGSSANCVPDLNTNVVFKNSSFTSNNDSVILDTSNLRNAIFYCKSMTWEDDVNSKSPTFFNKARSAAYFPFSRMYINGSIRLASGMNFNTPDFDYIMIGNENNSIQSNGQSFKCNFTYLGGGSLSLLDSFSSNDGHLNIISNGIFKTNNHRLIILGGFYLINHDSWNNGSKYITLPIENQLYGTTDLGTSLVQISKVTNLGNPYNYQNDPCDYHSLECSKKYNLVSEDASILFTRNNSNCNNSSISVDGLFAPFKHKTLFNKIEADSSLSNFTLGDIDTITVRTLKIYTNSSLGRGLIKDTIILKPGTTNTILNTITLDTVEYKQISGTCDKMIFFNSPDATVTTITDKGTAPLVSAYQNINNVQYINTQGNATTNNSILNGNTPGWNATLGSPRVLYWVGNGGNWNDKTHWSLDSTATIGNQCPPVFHDDVYFTTLSFNQPNQIILMSGPIAVRHFNAITVNNSPKFQSDNLNSSNRLTINGDFILGYNLNWNWMINVYDYHIQFNSHNGIIAAKGKLVSSIYINRDANYIVRESLTTSNDYQGGARVGLIVDGKVKFEDSIRFDGQLHHVRDEINCVIDLGKCTIILNGNSLSKIKSNAIFISDSSTLYSKAYATVGGCQFRNIVFKNVFIESGFTSGIIVLDTLKMKNNTSLINATINNQFIIDTNQVSILYFRDTIRFNMPGYYYGLTGRFNNRLNLYPVSPNTQYVFMKASGGVCVDKCQLSFCKGYTTGNAEFRGGEYADDVKINNISTNTNWDFTPFSRIAKSTFPLDDIEIASAPETVQIPLNLFRFEGSITNQNTNLLPSDFPAQVIYRISRDNEPFEYHTDIINNDPFIINVSVYEPDSMINLVVESVSGLGCFSIPRAVNDSIYIGKCLRPRITINNPCIGDTIKLSDKNFKPNRTYYWTGPNGFTATTPSATIPNVSTLNDGVYVLRTYTPNCGYMYDSINFKIHSINGLLGIDKVLCYADTIRLNATTLGASSYQWGRDATILTQTTPTLLINNNTSGNYWVAVTKDSCISRDTVKITFMGNIKTTNIPRSTTHNCVSNIEDMSGILYLNWKNRTNTGTATQVGGISHYVQDLQYTLRKDDLDNNTYDEQCSHFVKSGTLYSQGKDTLIVDNLSLGDYKIILKPINLCRKVVVNGITTDSTCIPYSNCYTDSLVYTFSIKKHIYPPPLGEDKILCPNAKLDLKVPSKYYNNLAPTYIKWGSECGIYKPNYNISTRIASTIATDTMRKDLTNGQGGLHFVEILTQDGCIIRDTVVVADLKPQIKNDSMPTALATNAVEYSSFWGTQYNNIKWEDDEILQMFQDANIYKKGVGGIYRPSKNHDYLDTLNSSTSMFNAYINPNPSTQLKETTIRNTGNIIGYRLFNYGNPLFADCVPQWIHNNTMTKYSPAGFDIENKDILGIHGSALYGYNDMLPIGVASNAKNDEIGFESFEEYSLNPDANNYFDSLTQLNNSTGNIDLIKRTISLFMPKTKTYDIVRAFNRYAMVKGNICSACDVPIVCQGIANSAPVDMRVEKIVNKTFVSNKTEVMGSPCGDSSYLILKLDNNLPSTDDIFRCRFWTGQINVTEKRFVPQLGTFNFSLDNTKAHTGNYSLKVPIGQRIFIPQVDLELEPKKTYHISAWIHTANMNLQSPENLAYSNVTDSIGINIILPNNERVFIIPNGEVIEGWQKVSGTFTMPSGMRTQIQIGFTAQKTFNIDDIRIYPQNSAIQTYVYDPFNYKVKAVLDQNNYATIYNYDDEGNLFALKKETVKGIKTIQVSSSNLKSEKP